MDRVPLANDLVGLVGGILLVAAGVACHSRSERIVHYLNRAAEFNRHAITFTSGNVRRLSIFAVILGLAIVVFCALRATGIL